MIHLELVADGQSLAGYAAHTRLMLRAFTEGKLLEKYDINVALVNRPKEQPAALTLEEGRLLQTYCSKVLPKSDVRVFFEPAQFAQFEPDVPTIVFTQWETDRISDYDKMGKPQWNWVAQLNKANLVMTSSKSAAYAFRRSKVERPVRVIPGPMFPHTAKGELPIRGLTIDENGDSIPVEQRPMVVGYMAQWSPRKNIEAFIRDVTVAFTDEQVVAVLKTYRTSEFREGAQLIEMVKTIKSACMKPNAPRFVVIHERLSNLEIEQFFNSVDIYYAPSHGEGFSIPVAMACMRGCEVIVPNWGGPADYVLARSCVGGQFSPVIGMGTYSWDQMWFDVDEKDAVMKLQDSYTRIEQGTMDDGVLKLSEMDAVYKRINADAFCKEFANGVREAIESKA